MLDEIESCIMMKVINREKNMTLSEVKSVEKISGNLKSHLEICPV